MSGQSPSPERCVFCELIAEGGPWVREWDDAVAFEPLNPVVPGHLLVVPKVHVDGFFSSPDVSAATVRRTAEMVHGVERHHDPHDYNVITSAGAAATQTVFHLHVHLVPRVPGDGLLLPWDTSEIERLREGWTCAEEEFERFLEDIAGTVPVWDDDLTPETVLAHVKRLAGAAS